MRLANFCLAVHGRHYAFITGIRLRPGPRRAGPAGPMLTLALLPAFAGHVHRRAVRSTAPGSQPRQVRRGHSGTGRASSQAGVWRRLPGRRQYTTPPAVKRFQFNSTQAARQVYAADGFGQRPVFLSPGIPVRLPLRLLAFNLVPFAGPAGSPGRPFKYFQFRICSTPIPALPPLARVRIRQSNNITP